jgi:hypothetical protein
MQVSRRNGQNLPDEYGNGEASAAAQVNTPVQAVQREDAVEVMAGGILDVHVPERVWVLRPVSEVYRLPNEMPPWHPYAAGTG